MGLRMEATQVDLMSKPRHINLSIPVASRYCCANAWALLPVLGPHAFSPPLSFNCKVLFSNSDLFCHIRYYICDIALPQYHHMDARREIRTVRALRRCDAGSADAHSLPLAAGNAKFIDLPDPNSKNSLRGCLRLCKTQSSRWLARTKIDGPDRVDRADRWIREYTYARPP